MKIKNTRAAAKAIKDEKALQAKETKAMRK